MKLVQLYQIILHYFCVIFNLFISHIYVGNLTQYLKNVNLYNVFLI